MIEKSETFMDEDLIEYRVSCDKCSYYDDFEVYDFDDLIETMRRRGWLSKKDKNCEWEHICLECKESPPMDKKETKGLSREIEVLDTLWNFMKDSLEREIVHAQYHGRKNQEKAAKDNLDEFPKVINRIEALLRAVLAILEEK